MITNRSGWLLELLTELIKGRGKNRMKLVMMRRMWIVSMVMDDDG